MVGMNAVVMDDAEVGAQAMVAACAFVPAGMQVAPRTLVAGIPAKVVRALEGRQRSPASSKARGPTRS